MKIGGVDLAREVLVIAEIGNNHEGDLGRARELVQAAAAAGAQAVKFQTIVPERLVVRSQTARIEQLRRFCLSYGDFEKLAQTAAQAKVMFLSTPFDLESVAFLAPLVPAFKIASSDNNFDPLLEAVARTGKPALISTGMTSIGDIKRTCGVFEKVSKSKPEIVLLHCVSAYPTPPESANLLALRTIERETGYPVGYSDHTLGIEQAVLSVALGACVIEKHFTLSKTQSEFRDHQLSAEPAELAELVRRVRAARAALGDGVKRVMPAEEGVVATARRSAVARRDLPAGHAITMEDLDWLRPGGGVAPDAARLLLGRKLRRAVAAGEPIAADMVA